MSKLTNEKVVEWKEAIGNDIFLLKVDLNKEESDDDSGIVHKEGVFYAVLKKAGRREIGLAMTAGKDPIAMGQSIIKNCWLDGDEEIKDLQYEDTVGLVAAMQAVELMSVGQGSLKKL